MDHQTVESSCIFSDRGSRHGSSIEHTTRPQEESNPPRRRNTQRICIFELPYDWDLQHLPPTVHGGGGGGREQRSSPSLQYHNEGGDSMNPRSNKKNECTPTINKMWCKSYITTSCDMDDDDLSSLGLDVEEYDFQCDGEEGPSIDEDDDDDVDFFIFDKEQQPVKMTTTGRRNVSSLWRKLTFGKRSTTTRRGQVGVAAPVSLEKSNQGSNNGVRGSGVPSTSSLSVIFDILTLSTFSTNLSSSTRSNKRGDHEEVDREDSTDRDEDDSLSVETFTSYRWTSPSTQGRPQHQQKEQPSTKPRSHFGRWRRNRSRRGRRSSIACYN